MDEPIQRTRLYRNESSQVLTGVCSGISDYFGVDVSAIRFVFIALLFFNFSSVILYILLTVILMPDPSHRIEERRRSPRAMSMSGVLTVIATVLIATGSFLIIHYFDIPLFIDIWSLPFTISFALFIIIIGLILAYIIYIRYNLSQIHLHWHLSDSDKIISGVIGGISEPLEVDPSVVRLFLLLTGILLIKLVPLLILVYVSAAIFAPSPDEEISP